MRHLIMSVNLIGRLLSVQRSEIARRRCVQSQLNWICLLAALEIRDYNVSLFIKRPTQQFHTSAHVNTAACV